MKIELKDSWSSPSVLHLRLTVEDDKRRWLKFETLHIPFELLPKGALLAWLIEDLDTVRGRENSDPLF